MLPRSNHVFSWASAKDRGTCRTWTFSKNGITLWTHILDIVILSLENPITLNRVCIVTLPAEQHRFLIFWTIAVVVREMRIHVLKEGSKQDSSVYTSP